MKILKVLMYFEEKLHFFQYDEFQKGVHVI